MTEPMTLREWYEAQLRDYDSDICKLPPGTVIPLRVRKPEPKDEQEEE
jgi:hypothetical protein